MRTTRRPGWRWVSACWIPVNWTKPKLRCKDTSGVPPQEPYGYALMGNLWLMRGNALNAVTAHSRALELRPDFVVSLLGVARSLYLAGDHADAEVRWRSLVENTNAAAQHRSDAAFDLAGVLRSQGRIDAAIDVLRSVETEIRDERVYEATMLSTLAILEVDRGNIDAARELVDEAMEASMVAPTRHLFVRGMIQLAGSDYPGLMDTVTEIRALALPPDDPDRTEDKAALFLEGLAALQRGDGEAALAKLDNAIALEGYRYALYELGRARALLATEEYDAAVSVARQLTSARDPGDLRLDLEYDRASAARLAAEAGQLSAN